MTMIFRSVDAAKTYAAVLAGVDPSAFEPVPGLQVAGLDSLLLDDPDCPEATKEEIRARLAAQQGFKFQSPAGKAQIVISPFRDGFDLWLLVPSGAAVRV